MPCFFVRVATGETFPVNDNEITTSNAQDSVRFEALLIAMREQIAHGELHEPITSPHPDPAADNQRGEKDDKIIYHRAFRRVTRQWCHSWWDGVEEVVPHYRDHSDPYNWNKDGRKWWKPQRADCERKPWHWWMK